MTYRPRWHFRNYNGEGCKLYIVIAMMISSKSGIKVTEVSKRLLSTVCLYSSKHYVFQCRMSRGNIHGSTILATKDLIFKLNFIDPFSTDIGMLQQSNMYVLILINTPQVKKCSLVIYFFVVFVFTFFRRVTLQCGWFSKDPPL